MKSQSIMPSPQILKITVVIESDTERYTVEVPHAIRLNWETEMEGYPFIFLKDNDGKVHTQEIEKVTFSFKPLRDEENSIGIIEKYEEIT